jgi:type I restriction enzyme S subunit
MKDLVKLDDVLKYEQPTKYIVDSINYDNSFSIPVLTAGKSFILGYTDELDGIYNDLPVIIFDDFTTAFHYVDFPFKVKSSAMKILKPVKEKADLKYLFYRMQTISMDTDLHKRYWISKYSQVKIPLPPLPQQQKIANILDAADALRQKDKALLAKYDELTQALFLDMFGDPVSNPKGWEKVKLKKLLENVPKIGKDYNSPNIEYVDISSINNLKFIITSTTNYLLDDRPSRAQQILKNGDILLSTVRPNLKNIAINNVNGYIASTGFYVCSCSNRINNKFLFEVLKSDSVTNYFVGITAGANYPAIKSSDVSEFLISLPPISLQNQFAERVQVIEQQKAIAQQSLEKSEALFNSLLQKAFKGELV